MKVIVYIATSLDGFIARKNGDIDWLPADEPESNEDYGFWEFFNTVDALVMGKNTFEKVLSFGIWPYKDKKVIVVSKSIKKLPAIENANLQLVRGDTSDVFNQLKQSGYQKIYLDGGKLIQSFLRDNLIDELIISKIPVLIGDGIPLFGKLDNDIKLEVLHSQAFKNGLVQTHYKVAK